MATTSTPATPTDLVVNTPAPITVAAPDVVALVQRYNTLVLPLWRKYIDRKIDSPESYTQASLDWNTFKTFDLDVEKLFESPCKEAYDAHRRLTGLREIIRNEAKQGALTISDGLKRYKEEEDRKRRLEEARIAAEEEQKRREEQARLQAEADAEIKRMADERAAALANAEDWEREEIEDSLPAVPEPVTVVLPEVAPVRLASRVPTVVGGPKEAFKPWAVRVTDRLGLLRWILENPDERGQWLADVPFDTTAMNSKCRELDGKITAVLPVGVESFRDTTLRRG